MKKQFILSLFSVMCFSLTVFSQNPASGSVTSSREQSATKNRFNPTYPASDKTDIFEVTGVGGTVFATSNVADGTPNSYKHSQKITMSLVVANVKLNNFQLVFYSNENETPYAASYTDGMLNIYFPIGLYEEIRQKLDQSLAAKKKVQVKVVQKTDGYREGTLIL